MFYGYGGNNPICFVDPLGLADEDCTCTDEQIAKDNQRMSVHFEAAKSVLRDRRFDPKTEALVGVRLDYEFKRRVQADSSLSHLHIVWQGFTGPDVYNPDCMDVIWEVTTYKQVGEHLRGWHNRGWPTSEKTRFLKYSFTFHAGIGDDPAYLTIAD